MQGIMATESSPRELVRKAQEGDREALSEVVELYRARLGALVRSRMGPVLRKVLEPEDIVQETFARALASLERFRWTNDDSFLRWLGGIAENLIVKAAAKDKRSETLELPREIPASGVSPSRGMQREERLERLQSAIAKLTPEQREVVHLARIEGLRLREIAERTHRSENAVKQLLLRGLRSLRRNFGETESFHLPGAPFAGGKEGGEE